MALCSICFYATHKVNDGKHAVNCTNAKVPCDVCIILLILKYYLAHYFAGLLLRFVACALMFVALNWFF